MRVLAVIVLSAAVSLLAAAPQGAARDETRLWAGLGVAPPAFEDQAPAAAAPFTVYFALVNDGEKTIDCDPIIKSSQLLVNGKEMADWPFVIANGIRDKRWHALPPGDNLSFTYALGDRFTKPGTYRLVWKGAGFQSPEVMFRKLPRRGS